MKPLQVAVRTATEWRHVTQSKLSACGKATHNVLLYDLLFIIMLISYSKNDNVDTPGEGCIYVVWFAEKICCFTTYFAYVSLVSLIYCRNKYIIDKMIRHPHHKPEIIFHKTFFMSKHVSNKLHLNTNCILYAQIWGTINCSKKSIHLFF